MTDYTATPEQWADTEHWAHQHSHAQACILELRARVKVLEDAAHKHIVETNSNILALFSRVESLEAAERQTSKTCQISKPLKLTARQQAELQALLTPNFRVGMTLTSTSNQVDSSPQPVAVSERLPGPEDCDVQGRCWLWERDCGYSGCKWALVDRTWSLSQTDEDLSVYTHWLPAHALPLPTPEAL